jgi:hypothetical protein
MRIRVEQNCVKKRRAILTAFRKIKRKTLPRLRLESAGSTQPLLPLDGRGTPGPGASMSSTNRTLFCSRQRGFYICKNI